MSDNKPGKHVIFLGAGASISSGYPSAVDLRKLLSSEASFVSHVEKHLGEGRGGGKAQEVAFKASFFQHHHSTTLENFRFGGYGTLDEFCYLAKGSRSHDIQKLKALMAFALAAINPELTFEDSDYYPFVQRLFEPNSDRLRSDICIINFNYDPILNSY
jgi:hypothetical protein